MKNSSSIISCVSLLLLFACGCDSAPSSNKDEFIKQPVAAGKCEQQYECKNITMLARLTPAQLLGENLNDVWGWTDPATGKNYALVGLTDRVTFVNITDPERPVVVGTLPESIHAEEKAIVQIHHDDEKSEGKSAWRDVKVYKNHAFIVSDGQPHGLQIFDLTRLREAENLPATFTEDVHYTGFGNAHNIAINEESGFAYVVGSDRAGGGLYILNISSPQNPVLAGSHTDTQVGLSSPGYVHDTQCVIYHGPDTHYAGRELCFNASETHLVIADVTDKQAAYTISRNMYANNAYAHQGWLTEDHRYFLLDDELDERTTGTPTTTYIWDIQDLDSPKLLAAWQSMQSSIDHNQFIKGNYAYQANYTTGLRVLELSQIASGKLTEVAYFDTYPLDNSAKFDGAWSTYPFFDDGVVLVSDISNGLFILSARLE